MVPCCLGGDSTGSEQLSDPGEHMTVARTEQTVIAYFDASVRQDVLKNTAHTLCGSQRSAFRLARGRFLGLQSDGALLQLEDVLIPDGNAKEVPSKRAEGCLATADHLTVHDPVLVPYVLINVSEEGSFFQLVSELGAEEHSQRLDVDEAVLA